MVDLDVGCLTCFQTSELNLQSVSSIQDALRKHFWFTETDLQQAIMCQSCWEQVNNFYRFYIAVEELYKNQKSSGLYVKPEPETDQLACLKEGLPECSSIKAGFETEKLDSEHSVSSAKEQVVLKGDKDVSANAVEDIGAHKPLTERSLKENSDQDVAKRKRVKKFVSEDERIKKHVKYTCERCGHESETFWAFKEHALQRHHNNAPFLVCCGKKYRKRKTLFQHVQLFRKPDILRCPKCEKNFKSRHAYFCHRDVCQASGSGDHIFDCDQCPRSFTTQHLFKEHMEHHANNWKCEKCDINFINGTRLKRHVTEAHPELPLLTCNVCSQRFPMNSLLQQHKQRHEQQKCQLCPSMLQDRKSLRAHVKKMHPEALICSTCQHVLPSRAALQAHTFQAHWSRDTQDDQQSQPLDADGCDVSPESSHGGTLDVETVQLIPDLRVKLTDCLTDGLLVCPGNIDKDQLMSSILVKEEPVIEDSNEEMEHIYQNKSGSDHSQDEMEQYQNDSEKQNRHKTKRRLLSDEFIRKHVKYICAECRQESLTFKDFMDHALEIHGDQLAFVACCGKKFRRKHLLFQHVQTLNNPNMFRCEECKSSFQTKQYYREHMRHVHVQRSKKYKCDRCGKSYTSKNILQRHRKDHLGEENLKWKCPHCEKLFLTRQTINYHIKHSHPGSPDFCCDICHQKFCIESWLVEHKLKHKELQCLLCPERFPYGKNLRAHVVKQHRGASLPVMCKICKDVLPDKVALEAHRVKEHQRQNILADDNNRLEADQLKSSMDVEKQTIEIVQQDEKQTESKNSEDKKETRDDVDLHDKRHQDGITLRDQVLERPPKDALSELTQVEPSQNQLVSIIVKSETMVGDDSCLEERLPECSYDNSVETERLEEPRTDGNTEHFFVDVERPDPQDELIKKHVQYKCEHCGRESETFVQLRNHVKSVHTSEFYVWCCGRKYPRKHLLLEHVQLVNNSELFRCKGCSKEYATNQWYQRHIRMCSHTLKNDVFKCDRCQKSFQEEDAYMYHLKGSVGSGETIGKCEHCRAVFTNCAKQEHHIRTMHPDAPETICDVCCAGFLVKEWFKEHTLGHKRDDELAGMFKCGLCPECFTSKAKRKLHVQEHAGWELDSWAQHFTELPQYICRVCFRAFRTDFLFQQHKLKHVKPTLK